MRALYSHYRAPHLYRRGKSCEDPTAIPECVDGLRKYGYHEHADELQTRYEELTKSATPVAVTPILVETPAKKARAKRSKKAE